MILQRMAQAIKRQDWFQVAIEILIVVIGIFLGLQVSGWNDERLNRIEEIDYVERLLMDADSSLAENKIRIERLNEKRAGREAVLLLLESKSITSDDIPRISELFKNSFRPGVSLDYFEDTLDELLSTGKLSVIRSKEFKNRLARFRSQLKFNDKIISLVTGVVADNTRGMINLLKWDIHNKLILTPPEKINNDEELYNHLVANEAGLSDMHDLDLQFNEQIKLFRDEVAAELERLQ